MTGDANVPLADISANFFAAFVLMLIAALAVGRVGADGDGEIIERRALRGDELVDLLYGRRHAEGVAVDLFDDHVTLLRPSGEAISVAPVADAIDAALDGERKVSLFVFSHGAYPAAKAVLQRRGIAWQEMSVPLALRDERSAGWSRPFLLIAAGSDSREAFKDGLARLLAGGGARVGGPAVDRLEKRTQPFLSGAGFAGVLQQVSVAATLVFCAILACLAERRRGRRTG